MSGGAVAVRTARERDLDRLAELFFLLLEDQAVHDPSLAPGAGAEAGLRALLAWRLRTPDARVLVAEAAPGPGPPPLLGFCVAALARRPDVFRERLRGEIEHVFVRSEARRAGVGRALIGEALAWLTQQGVARVALQVARPNRAGRAFWEALRFQPVMDVLERSL